MPLHAEKMDRKHIINNFFRTKKFKKLDNNIQKIYTNSHRQYPRAR